MRRGVALRFWLGGVLLLAAVGVLVWMTTRTEAAELVTVSQVLAEPDTYAVRRIRVVGKVVPGTTTYDEEEIVLEFRMEDEKGDEVAVRSLQPKPDAFKDGGPVDVTGYYDPAKGRIESEDLKAKCPSRYEEEPGGKEKDPAPVGPDHP